LDNPLRYTRWAGLNPLSHDSTGDGLSDAVKQMLGINLTTRTEDADQDGLTDRQEVCRWDPQAGHVTGGWDVTLPSGLVAHVCSDPLSKSSGRFPAPDSSAQRLGVSPYASYSAPQVDLSLTPLDSETAGQTDGISGTFVKPG